MNSLLDMLLVVVEHVISVRVGNRFTGFTNPGHFTSTGAFCLGYMCAVSSITER